MYLPVLLFHHRQVGAGTIVSRGIDNTVTCCRSALIWAIITTSELATLLVEASVPPIAALVPARLSEPTSRMFCAAYAGYAVGAAAPPRRSSFASQWASGTSSSRPGPPRQSARNHSRRRCSAQPQR